MLFLRNLRLKPFQCFLNKIQSVFMSFILMSWMALSLKINQCAFRQHTTTPPSANSEHAKEQKFNCLYGIQEFSSILPPSTSEKKLYILIPQTLISPLSISLTLSFYPGLEDMLPYMWRKCIPPLLLPKHTVEKFTCSSNGPEFAAERQNLTNSISSFKSLC